MRKLILPLTLSLLAIAPAFAGAMDHKMMDHGSPSASSDFYAKDMEDMHKAMMVTPTGDADVDFVRGMIPHHEGAVAMAKTLLEHGKDPELRKLAKDIITAQDKEIAFMKDWLEKHPAQK